MRSLCIWTIAGLLTAGITGCSSPDESADIHPGLDWFDLEVVEPMDEVDEVLLAMNGLPAGAAGIDVAWLAREVDYLAYVYTEDEEFCLTVAFAPWVESMEIALASPEESGIALSIGCRPIDSEVGYENQPEELAALLSDGQTGIDVYLALLPERFFGEDFNIVSGGEAPDFVKHDAAIAFVVDRDWPRPNQLEINVECECGDYFLRVFFS